MKVSAFHTFDGVVLGWWFGRRRKEGPCVVNTSELAVDVLDPM